MADTKPIYKRVNGEWKKQTAFQRQNGEWVKISNVKQEDYTLTYELTNNNTEYYVNSYSGEPIEVVIPSTYNGKPVTSISNWTFANCSSLRSVTIPDSVTSIGDLAFSACYSLTSITIPDSVTSIGYQAFSDCSLLRSVVIPNSVTSIGEGAFYGCDSLETIFCEAESQPRGWSLTWNYGGYSVVWGYDTGGSAD